MHPLPTPYQFLNKEPGPRILTEMLKLHGTIESPGPHNNPIIMSWAAELQKAGNYVGMEYAADSIPWCGIATGIAILRADGIPPKICARASSYDAWGIHQEIEDAALGDVLRFQREGGGHVGLYVGEDLAGYFHVLGGNQSDSVRVSRIAKSRCVAVRRFPWRVKQPANVRKVLLGANGQITKNEA